MSPDDDILDATAVIRAALANDSALDEVTVAIAAEPGAARVLLLVAQIAAATMLDAHGPEGAVAVVDQLVAAAWQRSRT